MPGPLDFLSADVITQEVQGNNATIPSASTTAYAMAGYSPRGPEDKALINGSFQEYVGNFGSFSLKSFNAYSAAAYFLNGGNELVFVRHLHGDATYATGAFSVNSWFWEASGRGTWADGAVIQISGNPNFFSTVSGSYSAFDVNISLIDPTSGLLAISEQYEALDLTDPTDPNYLVNVLTDESNDVNPPVLPVGGNAIPSALQPVSESNILFATGVSGQNNYSGSVSGTGIPILPGSMTFAVSGVGIGKDDGNGNIITSGTDSVSGQVNYNTGAIAIFISPAPNTGDAITTSYIVPAAQSVSITLAGGMDGSAVTAADVTNVALEPLHEGLYALDLFTDQFQLALPDYPGDPITQQLLITYAESRQDVVVITEPPRGSTPQQAANYKRNILNSVSSFAVMYYPWIKVPDPLNNNRPKLMPPSGHVAGLYANNDLTANVGKAPAGVNRGQLNFLTGVERKLAKTDRDLVYQAQINPIRSDSDVGTALWGNKTLQVIGDYTDINVRRLFIYLRKVQYVGLLDFVFEDVGPVTFGAIGARLNSFLNGLYLQGVIGSGVPTASQAFKVVCDQTNNPPAIQIQKKIIVDEFIKPNLAAEVIWLRIQRVFDASQVGS